MDTNGFEMDLNDSKSDQILFFYVANDERHFESFSC